MIDQIASKTAKDVHRALLAQLSGISAAPSMDLASLIFDSAEQPSVTAKSAPMVALEMAGEGAAAQPRLIQSMARLRSLRYSPADIDAARDALLAALTGTNEPIAADPETLALLTLAERVAQSTIPTIIEGPTGTGKEVLARFIHNASPRAQGPFIPVNCAAMPETILEAMLFGHRKGAFTGASEANEGFFRAADGGTLLLDEIGELPLLLQSKLLRALQEGEVTPVGATKPIKVDVRIIACTNRDLPQEMAAGRFREDLFYRLSVFPLKLLPLAQRPDDIGPLAFGMLLKHAAMPGAACWIAQDALTKLREHTWPGNVRELENVIRRAILLGQDAPQIGAEHIHFDAAVRQVCTASAAETMTRPVNNRQTSGDACPSPRDLADVSFHSEADAIRRALEACGGHRRNTAKRLGISERTLRYRLAAMREKGMVEAENMARSAHQ